MRKAMAVLAGVFVAAAVLPGFAAAAVPATVMQAMTKADVYWLAHGVSMSGATWQNATFHVGNLAYVAIPGAKANTATSAWAAANRYTVNSSRGSARPDDLAAGEVYLRLGHPASIRARVGSEVAAGNDTLWSYVDSLNMAMPSYARLGVLDQSTADLTAMQAQFSYTEKTLGLFDATKGLWWRDVRFRGSDVYWSRGNGWAMMAIAKVLQVLPTSDPRYSGFRTVFTQMAAALVPRQLADGLWGADLRNPSAYGYEASGTAFFTYAMAWGINAGILDPVVYGPVVNKAWKALSTIALRPSGEVGYIQGATTGAGQPSDGQPVKVTDTAAYGVGGFLLAGSQMMRISDPPVNLALPVVSGTATQGDTLTASTGTWKNAPTHYSYAWRDCPPSGSACTAISGATSSGYTVRASDVGYRIRAQVTATNTGGATTTTSAPTPVVTSTSGDFTADLAHQPQAL